MIPRRYVETSALLRVLLDGDEALRRARGEFPVEPIRSLDAIHLASVRVLDDELGGLDVASCDDRVRQNATALGFAVIPAAMRA